LGGPRPNPVTRSSLCDPSGKQVGPRRQDGGVHTEPPETVPGSRGGIVIARLLS
jgi:hypothetical protein